MGVSDIPFSLTIISNYEIINTAKISTLERLVGMLGVKVVLGVRVAWCSNSFFDKYG
jgi:hypothetical protein